MKCDFVVGQKVVMFVDFPAFVKERAARDGTTLPTLGVVYTVRELEVSDNACTRDFVFLRFVELVNGPHPENGIEPSFDYRMFRPVQERKTDISVFTALLTPAGKVPVDA